MYYASKDKPSAVLPPFPDVSSLELSDTVPKEKLRTFMVMYRAHCQRVLDSIVRATFDEVGEWYLHIVCMFFVYMYVYLYVYIPKQYPHFSFHSIP